MFKLWSLLSLSASLEIPLSTGDRLDILTLRISPSTPLRPSTPPKIQTRAWFSGNMTTSPPSSVTCAKLQAIRIRLDFLSIPDNLKGTTKRSRPTLDTADTMLLVDQLHMPSNTHVQTLNEVVKSMSSLSDSMATCYYQEITSASCRERSVAIPKAAGRRSIKFPQEIKDILVEWVEKHNDNPYPSAAEKLELMERTGLERCEWCKAV